MPRRAVTDEAPFEVVVSIWDPELQREVCRKVVGALGFRRASVLMERLEAEAGRHLTRLSQAKRVRLSRGVSKPDTPPNGRERLSVTSDEEPGSGEGEEG